MTVSMRVMSAGDGYKYLLRTVAAGDGQRSLSTPLTRYYSAKGTPPGRWMGNGLDQLAVAVHARHQGAKGVARRRPPANTGRPNRSCGSPHRK